MILIIKIINRFCQERIEVGAYSTLPSDYISHSQPVAFEIISSLNPSALNFLSEVDRRLSSLSGDPRETSFLFQRLLVIVQCFNSALIMDSFCSTDEDPDLESPVIFVLASSF